MKNVTFNLNPTSIIKINGNLTLVNVTINANNSLYGVVINSNNATINYTSFLNAGGYIYLNNSKLTAYNLSFDGINTFVDGYNFSINNVTNVPSTSGFNSLGEFLNISNTSTGSSILINFSYTGSVSGEDNLRVYKWTGTSWTVESNTGVDTTGKYVWANITPASIYGVLSPAPSTATTAPSTTQPSGGGVGKAKNNFTLSVNSFSVQLVLKEFKTESIEIKNTGDTDLTINVDPGNLRDRVLLTSYTVNLKVGETKTLTVTFVAGNSTGVFIGGLAFTAEGIKKTIPTSLVVESENILFDVKLNLSEIYKRVVEGSSVIPLVTLINVGRPEKTVDVLINYSIKDINGNLLLAESETMAVTNRTTFPKEFRLTDKFVPGEYFISAEVAYINSFAASSVLFEVIPKPPIFVVLYVLYIVFILVIILYISRKKRESSRSRTFSFL